MLSEERIDSWRQRVPSRLDRDDPFKGDGFGERPSTRLTFREASPPQRRPSTQLSFLRAATPLFGRSSTPSSRPASGMTERRAGSNRRNLLTLLSRKRKRKDEEAEIPREPVRLNFLFVGTGLVMATSLMQSDAFARPLYETYDTSGVPDLNTVEKLTYIEWDAIFLCFDISDKMSMYTIIQWWHHASNHGFAKTATFEPLLYLVGLKKDIRDQCFLEDHRTGSAADSSADLMAYPTYCVCPSEASWQAMRIGARKYIECSAATGEGMKDVIDGTGRDAMRKIIGEEWLEDEVVAPKKKRRFL
ncbi:GTP-binding rho1 [Fusarium sporotrichioides]|uniref:GTP-binding rho1 n=1 Tax=Fusarium sporotrichioides TaxID=5514 RepID=A0A395SAB8_FUSSP|nr:GTP-binding rho1 [Fusarium sporotrichioides]